MIIECFKSRSEWSIIMHNKCTVASISVSDASVLPAQLQLPFNLPFFQIILKFENWGRLSLKLTPNSYVILKFSQLIDCFSWNWNSCTWLSALMIVLKFNNITQTEKYKNNTKPIWKKFAKLMKNAKMNRYIILSFCNAWNNKHFSYDKIWVVQSMFVLYWFCHMKNCIY